MRDVPTAARWLGLAGLLPALACLTVAIVGEPNWRDFAIGVGGLYSGLILSFLGGTWWGVAATSPAAEGRGSLTSIWFAAVTPSLVALGAGLWWLTDPTHPQPPLVILAFALIGSLLADLRLARGLGIAPPWWLGLRIPLSLGLGLATLALAFV